jgi:large subunit ribosomal protein L21
MYAVIERGGKQYRVQLGTQFAVDRIEAAAPGDTLDSARVLLVADGSSTMVGTPVVAEAQVLLEVVRQDRGPKIIVFKYRPKARHRVKQGHRQDLTVLRVSDIVVGGRSAASEQDAERAQAAEAEAAAAADAERRAEQDRALADRLAREAEEAARAEVAAAGDGQDTASKAAPRRRTRRKTGSAAAGSAAPAEEDPGSAAETETPSESSDQSG